MKPVYQTKFGFEDGNCGNACIASILEISIDDIPNFYGKDPSDGAVYYNNMHKWCRDKPFQILPVKVPSDEDPTYLFKDCWCIASGKSPRAKKDWHRHAVVWRNGKIIHDPHPSSKERIEIDTYDIFVVKDPSILLKKD